MKTKHTPGPWYPVNYAGFINLQTEDIYGSPDLLDESKCNNAEANGKLAAAAPELLEFAIEMIRRYPNSPWIYEQGQKAIDKATK